MKFPLTSKVCHLEMKLIILFTKLVERKTDSENNQGFLLETGGFTVFEKSVCAAWLMKQVGSSRRNGQRRIAFISFGNSHSIWKGLELA